VAKKLITLVPILLFLTPLNGLAFPKNMDCEAAAKNIFTNMRKMINESVEKKIIAKEKLDFPSLEKKSTEQCEKEINTAKGRKEWTCHLKANSWNQTIGCST